MSRIGRLPIAVPAGVTVDIAENNKVTVKGPKGTLERVLPAEVLLQKRAMNKDSFPGRYDTSSAGHIQAGDEPEESAIRELHEELGIKASVDDLQFVDTFVIQYEKEFYGKMFKDSEIAFVYVYTKPVNIDELTLQKEELDGVEWFNLEYVYEECRKHNQKFCAPVGGLELSLIHISEPTRP